MHELAYNLESFNPAFTAVLLQARAWGSTAESCLPVLDPSLSSQHQVPAAPTLAETITYS